MAKSGPRFKWWWTRYIEADQHVRRHTHRVRVVVPTELESMHCSAVQRANVSVEHEAVRKVNSVAPCMMWGPCVRCFVHTSQSAARTSLITLCHSRVRVGRAAPSVKHASCWRVFEPSWPEAHIDRSATPKMSAVPLGCTLIRFGLPCPTTAAAEGGMVHCRGRATLRLCPPTLLLQLATNTALDDKRRWPGKT
jgi:hypothetical protein